VCTLHCIQYANKKSCSMPDLSLLSIIVCSTLDNKTDCQIIVLSCQCCILGWVTAKLIRSVKCNWLQHYILVNGNAYNFVAKNVLTTCIHVQYSSQVTHYEACVHAKNSRGCGDASRNCEQNQNHSRVQQ